MKTPATNQDVSVVFGSDILLQTLIANRVVSESGSRTNAYEIRNDRLVEQNKEQVRYRNGLTLPTNARILMLDAKRKCKHSQILANNIRDNTGTERPVDYDAHHIVAAGSKKIAPSQARAFLFSWGIAINDADNGVYLPRDKTVANGSLAKSHQNMHTDVYYVEVTVRLSEAPANAPDKGREVLRIIKKELIAGVFPF